MSEEADDIYDIVMTSSEETSGFKNLKARFEQQNAVPSTPPKPQPKPITSKKFGSFQGNSEPNGIPARKPTTAAKPGVPNKPAAKPPVADKISAKPPPVSPKTLSVENKNETQPVSPKNIANMFEKKIQNDSNNNNESKATTPSPKRGPTVGKLASASFLHKLENVTGGTITETRTSSDKTTPKIEKKVPARPTSLQRKDTLDVKLDGTSKPVVNVRKVSQIKDEDMDTEEGDIVTDKTGVKFREWPLPMHGTKDTPPSKPKKLKSVDMSEFSAEGPSEVYDDVVTPERPESQRPISYIAEYDSDEEAQDTGIKMPVPPIPEETYDDTMNGPDDMYDDGTSNPNEDDNIYEAYDDIIVDSPPQPPVPVPPRPEKNKTDPKKDKELKKEQKRKEEERKKKEEEEKKIRKLFKMDGKETCIYISSMLVEVKQTKWDLGVAEGEHVEIIRLINNPAGKWLCRNNYGKVGYVESSKIKPPDGKYDPSQYSQSPDETYDDVAADGEVYECIDVP